MNQEGREFFGCEVSFDEMKLRRLIASQSCSEEYLTLRAQIIWIIFDRTLEYDLRKRSLFVLFKHLQKQGMVRKDQKGISTAEMLKMFRATL